MIKIFPGIELPEAESMTLTYWAASPTTSPARTDLANNLVRAGMRTVQTIGVPDRRRSTRDADAVVVALKSRTAPVAEAVAQSLAAAALAARARRARRSTSSTARPSTPRRRATSAR